jgi:hypothetical protein
MYYIVFVACFERDAKITGNENPLPTLLKEKEPLWY